MKAIGARMVRRMKTWLKKNPDAPFVDGLTVKEYLELSDDEERILWDRMSELAEKELRNVGELDIPTAAFAPSLIEGSAKINRKMPLVRS